MSAPAVAARRPRLRDLLAAEWIKLWSLRSTYWILGLGVAGIIAIAVQGAIGTYKGWPSYPPIEKATFNPMAEAMHSASVAVILIGAGSLGALSIAGEYASGLIRTTFIAVPDRLRVVAAKVLVVAGVMLAAGAVMSLGTFDASQAILSGRHIGLAVGDPGVPRVLLANALVAPLGALVGMGLGALLRHTATTIVAVCAVLIIVPGFFKPNVHQWANDLYGLFPYYVWRNCLSLTDPPHAAAMPTLTGSWIVFAAWPLAAAVAAALAVWRRDV